MEKLLLDLKSSRTKLWPIEGEEYEKLSKLDKLMIGQALEEANGFDLWFNKGVLQLATNLFLPLNQQPEWYDLSNFKGRKVFAEANGSRMYNGKAIVPIPDNKPETDKPKTDRPEPRKPELFALKQLRTPWDDSKHLIKTSVRELAIQHVVSSRRPTNVVRLRGIVQGQGCVYMALDYLSVNLADYLDCCLDERKGLSKREIQKIFGQVLLGLDEIHKSEIIHRDLCPGNVLIDSLQRVKICDFGDARRWAADTYLTPGVGTLWYRAPEICLGAEKYDYAVDMWAAGMILGELFLLEPLIQADTDLQMVDLIGQLIGKPSQGGLEYLEELSSDLVQWKKSPAFASLSETGTLPLKFQFHDIHVQTLLRGFLTWNPEDRLSAKEAVAGFGGMKASPWLDQDKVNRAAPLFEGSEDLGKTQTYLESEPTPTRLVLQKMHTRNVKRDYGRDSAEYKAALKDTDELRRNPPAQKTWNKPVHVDAAQIVS